MNNGEFKTNLLLFAFQSRSSFFSTNCHPFVSYSTFCLLNFADSATSNAEKCMKIGSQDKFGCESQFCHTHTKTHTYIYEYILRLYTTRKFLWLLYVSVSLARVLRIRRLLTFRICISFSLLFSFFVSVGACVDIDTSFIFNYDGKVTDVNFVGIDETSQRV